MKDEHLTINQLIILAQKRLTASSSSMLDAEVLLAYVLQKNREYLYTWRDVIMPEDIINSFEILIKERERGCPVAYLTGNKEFWSLDFFVEKSVMIPRPETELAVEIILESYSDNKSLSVADLGTGCGTIALALASEKNNWKIIATDISPSALRIASKNAAKFGLSNNVEFYLGSWCQALPDVLFDVIVSNPPYISENDKHLFCDGICFEPLSALVSESNGLQDIIEIAKNSKKHLKKNGMLILEHGYDQGKDVRMILYNFGYQNTKTFVDLNGLDRVTIGCFVS
jgi:release factor glutamine methyltransferase